MKLAKLKPRTAASTGKRPIATLEELHRDKRLRGRALQERNRRLMQERPICVDCDKLGQDEAKRAGYGVTVDEWDHEIPLASGGQDIESNISGRCFKHHAEKSERERLARTRGDGKFALA